MNNQVEEVSCTEHTFRGRYKSHEIFIEGDWNNSFYADICDNAGYLVYFGPLRAKTVGEAIPEALKKIDNPKEEA